MKIYSPNVEQIRAQTVRQVRGPIPQRVRNELMAAVKAGDLGRLKKDGLKPEFFFHPDHKDAATEMRLGEAARAIACIARVTA